MGQEVDIKFMRRCLELAVKAEGFTYPNPLVGAVIVHDGRIIGEGFHLKAGRPHAEVNAVNSVKERELLKESTLYVNLEPCSHTGKTPPCADFIISHRIPRVIIGSPDTSDKVSGKGIAKLTAAGCEVRYGILEDECRYLNRRFFTFHEKKRPYITLKWAQSADGFIDILRKEDQPAGPYWISGKPERVLVHRWRASEESILAGAGTIRKDDPSLNVREWTGFDPLRIILSRSGDLPGNAAIFKLKGRSILFTKQSGQVYSGAETVLLNNRALEVMQVADYLYSEGIQSLMIEGGAEAFESFITAGLWDEARIFTGKTVYGSGIKAPFIRGKVYSRTEFSCSSLEIILRDVSTVNT
jgi:diaminohydroxyphosphoribosylaminopyrimidine deaminase/5-amino-6-(5-phosphoribosylamino)uracil reductase